MSTAPLAFRFEASDGSAREISGPQLEDFSLYCTGHGIRFNDPDGTFTDSSGQQSVMRPYMRRIRLFGPANDPGDLTPVDGATVGVYWVKCFDGVIDQCEIRSFGIGYKSKGSDLCSLRGRTKITACNTAVDLESTGSFGSGTLIDGADIIIAFERFIRSSDKDLMLRNSYLEMYPASGTYTGICSDFANELENSYCSEICNNRLELPSNRVANFLKITGDGQKLLFEHNKHAGVPWGAVEWMAGAGALYWKNQYQRQRIIQTGNATRLALPYNSLDTMPARDRRTILWAMGPNTPGMEYGDHGSLTCVVDGAFVLERHSADDTHKITFYDAEGGALSGTVDVWVEAKATGNAQVLSCYHLNGIVYQATATQALTTSYAWYKLFDGITVADLRLNFLNKDAGHAFDIHLREIVVKSA